MKIVVIGGTGLIGSRVVQRLRARGEEAVPAAPDKGVNTLTGEGLSEALQGAAVVVDVSNSPSFEASAALEFFETTTRHVLDAEESCGVVHHVALSIVGADRLTESGYVTATLAQEKLVKTSPVPYSIVHATQFFEFGRSIADMGSDGSGMVRVPAAMIQPMAADDVAAALCDVACGAPVKGTIEIGGPEALTFKDFVQRSLRAVGDERVVVADPETRYDGAKLSDRTLLPDVGAQLGPTTFEAWLGQQARGR